MEKNSCYMCSKPATSREHVPPQCLFPENKDLPKYNFRKNLITVPSCDEHNLKKSRDDEFLMVSLASIVGNNILGYFHTKTKIDRALKRKSREFLGKVILRKSKEKLIQLKSGKKIPVLYGEPDVSRLLKCFQHISYGLYYHQYQIPFKGEIRQLLGFIIYKEEDSNTFIKFLKRRFELEDLKLEPKGDNPEVFLYQFCKPDKDGLVSLKLTFYSSTEVYVLFIPKDKKLPFFLVSELLNAGVPTTLTLGDERFHFNHIDKNKIDIDS
ncbi:MAG: hypothetical protein ACNS60_19780 [Candidatus Cyclobacteriaceae bacterium M2_1C_046]